MCCSFVCELLAIWTDQTSLCLETARDLDYGLARCVTSCCNYVPLMACGFCNDDISKTLSSIGQISLANIWNPIYVLVNLNVKVWLVCRESDIFYWFCVYTNIKGLGESGILYWFCVYTNIKGLGQRDIFYWFYIYTNTDAQVTVKCESRQDRTLPLKEWEFYGVVYCKALNSFFITNYRSEAMA